MKRFSIMLVAAVVFAIGSAFTSTQKDVTSDWYLPLSNFAPGSAQAQNITNYDQSNPLDEAPGTCNEGSTYVCAARFPNTGSAPTEYVTRSN